MNLHVISLIESAYLGFVIKGRVFGVHWFAFSTISATLVGYLTAASSAHFFLRASEMVKLVRLTQLVLFLETDVVIDIDQALCLHQAWVVVDRLS